MVNKCLLISTPASTAATSALLLPILFYFLKVIIEYQLHKFLVVTILFVFCFFSLLEVTLDAP